MKRNPREVTYMVEMMRRANGRSCLNYTSLVLCLMTVYLSRVLYIITDLGQVRHKVVFSEGISCKVS